MLFIKGNMFLTLIIVFMIFGSGFMLYKDTFDKATNDRSYVIYQENDFISYNGGGFKTIKDNISLSKEGVFGLYFNLQVNHFINEFDVSLYVFFDFVDTNVIYEIPDANVSGSYYVGNYDFSLLRKIRVGYVSGLLLYDYNFSYSLSWDRPITYVRYYHTNNKMLYDFSDVSEFNKAGNLILGSSVNLLRNFEAGIKFVDFLYNGISKFFGNEGYTATFNDFLRSLWPKVPITWPWNKIGG